MVSGALRLISGYGQKPRPNVAEATAVPLAYKLALDQMSQGLCVYDGNQQIVLSNKRFAALYGLAPEHVKPGTSLQAVIEQRIRIGIYAGASPEAYLQTRTTPTIDAAWDEVLSNGRTVHIVTSALDGGGWVSTHEDVTEQRVSEERYAHLAKHDTLTGLGNRLALRERLDLALAQALRGYGVALLWINVDHFRCINDYHGLSVGDAVLKEIASRLQQCVQPGDTVVRFGSDEFAVLQVGVNEPTTAASLARTILERLCKPYLVAGQSIATSVSIGISLAPGDAFEAEALIKNADIALNVAKTEGRKSFRFFQPDMDVAIRSRQQLEAGLRQALASGEFEAIYQPIIDLKSGRVSTMEALVRWRNRDGDLISPNAFIMVAEQTGLIRPIGAWMSDM